MTNIKKILDTSEAWESGELGTNEFHAIKYDSTDDTEIDEALGLQMISIRLEKQLLTDLKAIAQYQGLGYQPLIRQILNRFATSEMKQMAREALAESVKAHKAKDKPLEKSSASRKVA